MPVQLNHTIVAGHDAETSARWFAEMFGIDPPQHFGPFWQVETANGVALDFGSTGDREIAPQHYAFLVDESDFDAIHGRIVERGLDHWADPMQRRPGEINHHDGGPDVYFLDILTRPYGSGG